MPRRTHDPETRVAPGRPTLRTMREADLAQVVEIERRSFASPWKRHHFLHELRENPWAAMRVMDWDGKVVAYACLWFLDDEMKVNNLAVDERMRGEGLGSRLLRAVLEEGREHGCRSATLEVRPSNLAARRLYRRHGFRELGRRRGYYAIEGEDAIVMELELAAAPDRGDAVG